MITRCNYDVIFVSVEEFGMDYLPKHFKYSALNFNPDLNSFLLSSGIEIIRNYECE